MTLAPNRRLFGSLPFFAPHGIGLFVLAQLLLGRPAPFQIMVLVFVLAPFLDRILGVDREVSGDATRHRFEETVVMPLAVWSWIPIQGALVLGALLSVRNLAVHDVVALAVGAGMTCGTFGVTAAHELMHRRDRWHQAGAAFLLLLLSYPHFLIEHVHGHHKNVGTPDDPATSRQGESLYAFLFRSVLGGWRSAWRHPAMHNRFILSYFALIVGYLAVAYAFGPKGVLMFAAQSAVAVFLVETLNYAGHYGLVRKRHAGFCEPVRTRHSWNSSHRASNWLLFNVGRHSDHHCEPGRGYLSLRHKDEAPQLPGGYFSMFVLALFPPLWRRTMDPLVQSEISQ